jgi:hypothetical protein
MSSANRKRGKPGDTIRPYARVPPPCPAQPRWAGPAATWRTVGRGLATLFFPAVAKTPGEQMISLAIFVVLPAALAEVRCSWPRCCWCGDCPRCCTCDSPAGAGRKPLLAAGLLSAIVFPAGAKRLLSPGPAPAAAQPGSGG